MGSLNKVILIGNLGRDAVLTYTRDNQPRLYFSLATTEEYKDRTGAWQKRTDWHNVVAWGNTAQGRAEKFKCGRQVFVEGRINTHKYVDKEGAERTITEVTAFRMLLLGRPAPEETGVEGDGATADVEVEAAAAPF